MSVELVALAILMAAVTYPSRTLPLLAPRIERLPPALLEYQRLVGPSILSSLAAVRGFVVEGARRGQFHIGKWLSVAVCIGLVA